MICSFMRSLALKSVSKINIVHRDLGGSMGQGIHDFFSLGESPPTRDNLDKKNLNYIFVREE